MFGRLPQIAIDIELGLVNGGEASHSKFAQDIREHLEYCHASAKKAMESAAKRAKSNYDSKFCSATLEIGDHVLVKKTGFQDRHKLSDRWDDVTYVVVKKPCIDVPVYEVESLVDSTVKKILHRNMLLPLRKLNENVVVNLEGNVPTVHRHEDNAVHIDVDNNASDIDSDQSGEELQQNTIRRSKRATKPVDRLQVNQIFAEKEILDVEYSRKRDFAQMLFNQVFPT
jgi:hypothetical protein